MHYYKPLLLLGTFCFICFTHLGQAQLSTKERDFAIAALSTAKKDLHKITKTLSTDQLSYKPNDTTWSIAECVEHIAISESILFGIIASSLTSDVATNSNQKSTMDDQQVIDLIENRDVKVKTRAQFEPSDQFGSFKGALTAFNKRRKNTINYVNDTNDHLRNHYFEFPFGKVDTYQVILFMAGHSNRHIKQIQEVLSSPSFPTL